MSATNQILKPNAGACTDWISSLRVAVSSLNDLLKQKQPSDDAVAVHLQEVVDLAGHAGIKPDLHRFDYLPD
jgi:hypothetical protein